MNWWNHVTTVSSNVLSTMTLYHAPKILKLRPDTAWYSEVYCSAKYVGDGQGGRMQCYFLLHSENW